MNGKQLKMKKNSQNNRVVVAGKYLHGIFKRGNRYRVRIGDAKNYSFETYL